jgi:hypothetical protein
MATTEPSPRQLPASPQSAEIELFSRLTAEEGQLIAYGYDVLVGALRVPGAAYGMARGHDHGVGVRGLARLPSDLVLDEDDARSLAVDVLAKALPPFLQALKDGRWDPAGPANLKTFFVRRCLMELPDRYEHQARRRAPEPIGNLTDDDGGSTHGGRWLSPCGQDPADQATTAVLTDTLLAQVDPDARAMLELQAAGYRQAEIVEMFAKADRTTRAGRPWTDNAVRTAMYRAAKEVR